LSFKLAGRSYLVDNCSYNILYTELLVKTEKEASTIADAMFQFALFTDRDSKGNSKYAEKMWRVVFITAIEEGGWNSLERWAAQYRKDTEAMLLSIGVCPRCEANLTREHAPGKEILRCPSCNSSWTSARKA